MSVTLIAVICAVCVRTWRRAGLVALIAWVLWAAWMAVLVTLTVTRSPGGDAAQLAGYVTAELLTGAGAVAIATIVGHALRRLGSTLAGGPKEPRGVPGRSHGEASS